MYSSLAANPLPVYVVDFPLDTSHSSAPSTVSAQLTVNGTSGQTFYYDTSNLNPGDLMEIALQAPATLSTGRYSYSVTVVENYSTPVTYTYSGSDNVINEASSPFGSGWSLDAVERLWPVSGSGHPGAPRWLQPLVLLQFEVSFLRDPTGRFLDLDLQQHDRGLHPHAEGRQTSVVDRNGNTTNSPTTATTC